ncbi:hypothetical protein BZA05DRAFT_445590 [Tricharina praecox]|uniref:uncharacterized protein n=1 Tax=Tricharina praecox TaxID=43433 RepID=UPI00221E7D92|nr:uncharacterized protein BZA05DRAFT_445590 [Tricharina praecox]KAI5850762.1 hypothetical protein BZA05DRAFT_445590 [Tricharina praecox]
MFIYHLFTIIPVFFLPAVIGGSPEPKPLSNATANPTDTAPRMMRKLLEDTPVSVFTTTSCPVEHFSMTILTCPIFSATLEVRATTSVDGYDAMATHGSTVYPRADEHDHTKEELLKGTPVSVFTTPSCPVEHFSMTISTCPIFSATLEVGATNIDLMFVPVGTETVGRAASVSETFDSERDMSRLKKRGLTPEADAMEIGQVLGLPGAYTAYGALDLPSITSPKTPYFRPRIARRVDSEPDTDVESDTATRGLTEGKHQMANTIRPNVIKATPMKIEPTTKVDQEANTNGTPYVQNHEKKFSDDQVWKERFLSMDEYIRNSICGNVPDCKYGQALSTDWEPVKSVEHEIASPTESDTITTEVTKVKYRTVNSTESDTTILVIHETDYSELDVLEESLSMEEHTRASTRSDVTDGEDGHAFPTDSERPTGSRTTFPSVSFKLLPGNLRSRGTYILSSVASDLTDGEDWLDLPTNSEPVMAVEHEIAGPTESDTATTEVTEAEYQISNPTGSEASTENRMGATMSAGSKRKKPLAMLNVKNKINVEAESLRSNDPVEEDAEHSSPGDTVDSTEIETLEELEEDEEILPSEEARLSTLHASAAAEAGTCIDFTAIMHDMTTVTVEASKTSKEHGKHKVTIKSLPSEPKTLAVTVTESDVTVEFGHLTTAAKIKTVITGKPSDIETLEVDDDSESEPEEETEKKSNPRITTTLDGDLGEAAYGENLLLATLYTSTVITHDKKAPYSTETQYSDTVVVQPTPSNEEYDGMSVMFECDAFKGLSVML